MPKFNFPSPSTLTPKLNARDSSEGTRPGSPSQLWLGNAKQSIWSNPRIKQTRTRLYQSKRQVALLLIFLLAIFFWFTPPPSTWRRETETTIASSPNILSPARPVLAKAKTKHGPDPEKWLRDNSHNKWAVGTPSFGSIGAPAKPRAALISLVRNQELEGIVQSMTQLEYHWNHKYQYPWVFFNDEPFSDEFKVSWGCTRIVIDS